MVGRSGVIADGDETRSANTGSEVLQPPGGPSGAVATRASSAPSKQPDGKSPAGAEHALSLAPVAGTRTPCPAGNCFLRKVCSPRLRFSICRGPPTKPFCSRARQRAQTGPPQYHRTAGRPQGHFLSLGSWLLTTQPRWLPCFWFRSCKTLHCNLLAPSDQLYELLIAKEKPRRFDTIQKMLEPHVQLEF